MTVFAACLFALAAMASAFSILMTIRRYGPNALTFREQLAACPGTLVVTWKVIERVQLPALASLRKGPARRTRAAGVAGYVVD
ncbi:hypothetical protein ACFSLT_00015 [Novosphingobium resinovorum]|uniref:hypothetical protein n=1 Tax=Novosphingobium resinovorum TaxID=158500 RepID=UPI0036154353